MVFTSVTKPPVSQVTARGRPCAYVLYSMTVLKGNKVMQVAGFMPTRLWRDPARRWTAKQSGSKGQVYSGHVAV